MWWWRNENLIYVTWPGIEPGTSHLLHCTDALKTVLLFLTNCQHATVSVKAVTIKCPPNSPLRICIDEGTFVYIWYALCWSVVDNCLAIDSTVYMEEVDFFALTLGSKQTIQILLSNMFTGTTRYIISHN